MYSELRQRIQEAEAQKCESSETDHDYNSKDRQTSGEYDETRKQKRFTLAPEVRDFLDQIFARQPCPNRKDRELIAKKCGITKLQVRVWVRLIFLDRADTY